MENQKVNSRKKSKKSLLWKIPVGVLLTLLLVVIVYVAYVFISYKRIDDNLVIETTGTAKSVMKVGEEYTAVTFNAGFGAYTADFTFFMDGGSESRARSKESVLECTDGCGNIALSYKPDIVLFQEVDIDSTRSFHVDQAKRLNDLFENVGEYDHVFAMNYDSAYLFWPLNKPHGASKSGLLTESRFDVSTSLRRSLPIATGVKKILDLDRCYCISRIPVENGKELVLINTHLSAYGTDASQGNAQLEMMFEDMKAEYDKGNYVICGGDFNHDFPGNSNALLNPSGAKDYSWCQPFPDSIIPKGFSKCVNYAEGLVASTRNTDIPYSEKSFTVTLDGFIISDNIKCNYVQVKDHGFEYTDHNPVVMRFELIDHVI